MNTKETHSIDTVYVSDCQSIWELGIRLNNGDPYASTIGEISTNSKDAIKYLHQKIMNQDITAHISDAPLCEGLKDFAGQIIDSVIAKIELSDAVVHNNFDVETLRSIHIRKENFLEWCIKTDHMFPIFWANEELISNGVEMNEPVLDNNESLSLGKDYTKKVNLKHCQRARVACGLVAENLWKIDESISIKQMADCDEIKKICNSNSYSHVTRHNWIKAYAPKHQKVPGRKPT